MFSNASSMLTKNVHNKLPELHELPELCNDQFKGGGVTKKFWGEGLRLIPDRS